MKVQFKTKELAYFYVTPLKDLKGKLPFQKDIIKQFKKKIAILISIQELDDLKQFNSLNFKTLQGDRAGQYSIRLNRTYRLIFTAEKQNNDIIIDLVIIMEISKHYQ